ncbi:hypothetical protein Tco_0706184 [Tanacetum coccineum]|uniref:Uncharacterized protein n=1 Tax=Tanacetum coccineum TaxID=301880 RepID=A0ABQ4Y8A1_9ASTR
MEKLGPDVGGLENELYKLVCKVEEDEGHIGVFGVATKFSQQKGGHGSVLDLGWVSSLNFVYIDHGWLENVFKVVSSGWSFVYAILGQMTYSVASPTLDSAGPSGCRGASFHTEERFPV